ncbi:hypothetical protein KM043_005732 [Ampulex compressa]|nr:hypothetical protein KM043_005732 [Ampulex compressa]
MDLARLGKRYCLGIFRSLRSTGYRKRDPARETRCIIGFPGPLNFKGTALEQLTPPEVARYPSRSILDTLEKDQILAKEGCRRWKFGKRRETSRDGPIFRIVHPKSAFWLKAIPGMRAV